MARTGSVEGGTWRVERRSRASSIQRRVVSRAGLTSRREAFQHQAGHRAEVFDVGGQKGQAVFDGGRGDQGVCQAQDALREPSLLKRAERMWWT
jgi:hypothetical protein